MYGQKAFSYIALLLWIFLPEGYKELLSSKRISLFINVVL